MMHSKNADRIKEFYHTLPVLSWNGGPSVCGTSQIGSMNVTHTVTEFCGYRFAKYKECTEFTQSQLLMMPQ